MPIFIFHQPRQRLGSNNADRHDNKPTGYARLGITLENAQGAGLGFNVVID
ncbi:MAG: hypothetical protein OER85_05515 [Gammaproteobacteria bacterium]|nr:hypothetical protein [Gammaproteobacteria bacterium]